MNIEVFIDEIDLLWSDHVCVPLDLLDIEALIIDGRKEQVSIVIKINNY